MSCLTIHPVAVLKSLYCMASRAFLTLKWIPHVEGWKLAWRGSGVFLCVFNLVLGTGVSDEGVEGHSSHLLLSCPEQPAQQHSQIPRRPHPLVQILIAHQQLQSHLSAATCQGNAVFLSALCDLTFTKKGSWIVVKEKNLTFSVTFKEQVVWWTQSPIYLLYMKSLN